MQNAKCKMQNAKCKMQNATGNWQQDFINLFKPFCYATQH